MPVGWYLKCITAGTTSNNILSINNPTVVGDVTDGTVVWRIIQRGYNSEGCLYNKISIRSDSSIRKVSDDGEFKIVGAVDGTTNPFIVLRGKNFDSGTRAGSIQIVAHTNETNGTSLTLYPDLRCTLNENDLSGASIVAKSLNTNGYIKYASGLILQWGVQSVQTGSGMQTTTVSFPITFPTALCSYSFIHDYRSWSFYNGNWHDYDRNYGTSARSTSSLSIIGYNTQGGVFCWQAIGY